MKVFVFGSTVELGIDGWASENKLLERELNDGFSITPNSGDMRYYPSPQSVALTKLYDAGVKYKIIGDIDFVPFSPENIY